LEKDGHYGKEDIFGSTEILPLASMEDIKIPLWEVFEVVGPEKRKI